MGNKNNNMRRNVQTDLYAIGIDKYHSEKRPGEPNGSNIRVINKHPGSKMGQILALFKFLNLVGLSLTVYAFIANGLAFIADLSKYVNGGISAALGILGIVWFYWRIREKRADTKMKEFTMEDAEDAHIEKRKATHK